MIYVKNTKSIWLWSYIASNVIAAAIILNSETLLGDFDGFPFKDDAVLLFALSLVVGSYFFMLGPFFSWMSKFKVSKAEYSSGDSVVNLIFGVVLFVLQLGFMIFNLTEGVNVAGDAGSVSSSPLAIVWVFIPVDYLFLIYYPLARGRVLFKCNFILWVVSNLLRGWSGVFLFIIFFELAALARKGKLSVRLLSLVGVVVFIAYPFILSFKWVVRSASKVGMDLGVVFSEAWKVIGEVDYMSAIGDGLLHLVGRLQTVSNLIETMLIKNTLAHGFDNGEFAPFWKEGLLGIAYDRLFLKGKSISLNVMFTQYAGLNGHLNFGDWNINIGFLSWVFVSPECAIFYFLYIFLLCGISVFLTKKINSDVSQVEGLWLIWLLFLMPPWLGAFVGYIYALIFYIIVKFVINYVVKIYSVAVVGK